MKMREDRRRLLRKDDKVWTEYQRQEYREQLMRPGPIMTLPVENFSERPSPI